MRVNALTRRTALLLAAAGALALSACDRGGSASAGGQAGSTLGRADAPVTVEEYASPVCGVCAGWDREVWPQFKAKYVDTGQVKYVLREILTDNAIAPAGFLTARCAGPGKAFGVLDAIYRDFENVVQDPRNSLLNIAKSAGLSEQQFEACITDEKAVEALQKRVERNGKDGITGTPTFFVQGKKLGGDAGGEQTLAQMSAAVDAAKTGKDPVTAAKAAGPKQ